MDAKDWVTLVGVFSTAALAVLALVQNSYRERSQRERDDRLRQEQQEWEERLRQKERRHKPRVEFSLDCTAYGPEGDDYAVEVTLTVENKGRIQQRLTRLGLRLRGIPAGQGLSLWEGHGRRLNFPVVLVDEEQLVPEDVVYYFVEPGIRQTFSYVTKVPRSVKYLLAHSRFDYGGSSYHTVERVFPMPG